MIKSMYMTPCHRHIVTFLFIYLFFLKNCCNLDEKTNIVATTIYIVCCLWTLSGVVLIAQSIHTLSMIIVLLPVAVSLIYLPSLGGSNTVWNRNKIRLPLGTTKCNDFSLHTPYPFLYQHCFSNYGMLESNVLRRNKYI